MTSGLEGFVREPIREIGSHEGRAHTHPTTSAVLDKKEKGTIEENLLGTDTRSFIKALRNRSDITEPSNIKLI